LRRGARREQRDRGRRADSKSVGRLSVPADIDEDTDELLGELDDAPIPKGPPGQLGAGRSPVLRKIDKGRLRLLDRFSPSYLKPLNECQIANFMAAE